MEIRCLNIWGTLIQYVVSLCALDVLTNESLSYLPEIFGHLHFLTYCIYSNICPGAAIKYY